MLFSKTILTVDYIPSHLNFVFDFFSLPSENPIHIDMIRLFQNNNSPFCIQIAKKKNIKKHMKTYVPSLS